MQGANWDANIDKLNRVMEIASDKCQLDHPLCTSCVGSIKTELQAQVARYNADREVYEAQLNKLRGLPPAPPVQLSKEERELEMREKKLRERLSAIQEERARLFLETRLLEGEGHKLSEHEVEFWSGFQDFHLELGQAKEKYQQLRRAVAVQREHLQRLKRTNIYDDAFHIYHSGHFGTINGFRLGRLPSQPVEWAEIDAALGQVALLLDTMARHCNFAFSKYRIVPKGSTSRLVKVEDPTRSYELSGPKSRMYWRSNFGEAMVALLECVDEFGKWAQGMDEHFKPPYEIAFEKINNFSIKQHHKESDWTKALKYMLINLKGLVAWTSKHRDH